MEFSYIEDTKVMIDGKYHMIKMENGMTGIGSRSWWLNGDRKSPNIVTQSGDISKGNHELYLINWRENPWDKVYIIIHEDEVPKLLNKQEQPEWRNPRKINLTNNN
jgi:hypothetical protein